MCAFLCADHHPMIDDLGDVGATCHFPSSLMTMSVGNDSRPPHVESRFVNAHEIWEKKILGVASYACPCDARDGFKQCLTWGCAAARGAVGTSPVLGRARDGEDGCGRETVTLGSGHPASNPLGWSA